MGTYFNPGNDGFARIVKGKYIDKTGLIRLINQGIEGTDGSNNLLCISRPRRFGKSYAAQMLCAYYDRSCCSRTLFDTKEIAGDSSYEKYLNRFDVIYIDMTGIIGEAGLDDLVGFIRRSILSEIGEAYPEVRFSEGFAASLVNTVTMTGRKMVMIIDEWDAPIRESGDRTEIRKEYLEFLRSLFKNSGVTQKIFAAAYMTGILPIKKDGSQSAISDFDEYSMLFPGDFAAYTGFTEEDVKDLCEKENMDFDEAKFWYDGYDFAEYGSVYNPFSVMSAMQKKCFGSYWKQTSAAKSLTDYIGMDFDGLQETVARLIAGEETEVDVEDFQNDLMTFESGDDVLTLLIHLGYLTYQKEHRTVRIPNEELRQEFQKILKSKRAGSKWLELVRTSEKLLQDTIAGDEKAVADAIGRIRESEYAPNFYNDEQALRYVIKFAYIAAMEQYAKVEEMPSGRGIADVVYIPKRHSRLPGLVIELKWNRSSGGAPDQIKTKGYSSFFNDFGGEIVTVGINYNEKTKEHTCRISKIIV